METKVRNGAAEDRITGAIESQTSRIPSWDIWRRHLEPSLPQPY